jgi:hypothetical protein
MHSGINQTTMIEEGGFGSIILPRDNDQPINLRNPNVGQAAVGGGLGAAVHNSDIPSLAF